MSISPPNGAIKRMVKSKPVRTIRADEFPAQGVSAHLNFLKEFTFIRFRRVFCVKLNMSGFN